MTQKKEEMMLVDTNERQREYVEQQKAKSPGLGIVFADAFLRGMRDIGYKNPAWAVAEMVDNSFQAGASTVAVRFGFLPSNTSRAKPDMVAVCDNGNGMIPEMISYAVRWGGTDREDDRTGFGRYGYGLPSSAVSMAKRYTVYSRARGGEWSSVTVDIEQLAAAAGSIEETQRLLAPRASVPPEWLAETNDGLDVSNLDSGTVIVLEDLDRLRSQNGWITLSRGLQPKLMQLLGVIYRHWIPQRRMYVGGQAVEVVDPLFLMEHGRFYDATPIHAEQVEARTIEVTTSRGTKGMVRIRASVMPPTFQLADPSKYSKDEQGRVKGDKLLKGRHEVMAAYNGLLICRERRHIDVVQPRWTTFQNYDRNIKIEIDFDPELDEFFGITTAKQQITIDEAMWEQLEHSGKEGGALRDLVKDLRRRFYEMKAEFDAKAESPSSSDEPRASVVAMEESARFKESEPEPTAQQQEEAQRNLDWAAEEESQRSGRPKDEVLGDLADRVAKRRWEVQFSRIPEGPFYQVRRLGVQKQLIINTDHPFYDKVYNRAEAARSALEVLLFVMAERELESQGDASVFYKAERNRWSERLRHALDVLVSDESLADIASAVAEDSDVELNLSANG